MSKPILFPTPNWFISRSIDIDKLTGSVAITAINSIILTNNLFDEYNYTIKDAHSKRLHGVSFGPKNFLASCSEDFDVKIWNLETRLLFSQHKLHQNSVTCVNWLQLENSESAILMSCDSKGNIYKYNLKTAENTRYYPDNKPITQISAQPGTHIVAVGYKQGTIVILDVSGAQMRIVHKLKLHEDSINCLAWTRIASQHYLISSGEDRYVRVWGEDGVELKCLRTPGSGLGGSGGVGISRQQQTINYTTLCCPKPGLILTSSFKGELFYYDLEKSLQQSSSTTDPTKWNIFMCSKGENQYHKKTIFDISSFNDKIITLSLDRLINIWDLTTFQQESSITTVNGFIYSISSSPIDPNFLAVSVGDSSIKFLNEKQDMKCTKSFNNNIKTEVTQVSWHPTKEALIAFGTKDGKVGIADIMANNKPAQYIYASYNQSVYTLVWSEPLISPKTINDTVKEKPTGSKKYFLYSVADGKIIQHHVQLASGSSICEPNTQSTNFYKELNKMLGFEIETEINKSKTGHFEYGLTEFAVFEEYFVIGKFDGSIEVYHREPQLGRICTLYNHQKLVTCIRWNLNSKLMASGSNDFNVIIVDFSKIIGESESNQKYFSQFKHKLTGHKERITGLDWSKIDQSLLVSCSYDSTVQVWNADLGLPLANYRGHFDKMLCCLFSSIDLNVVFSGGEDYCLHMWQINLQKNTTPPQECSTFSGKKRNNKHTKKPEKKPLNADYIAKEQPKINNNKPRQSSESEIDLEEKPLEVIKVITELEVQQNEKDQQKAKKPLKSGSPNQRDLKSIFILSSNLGGAKSNLKKLTDCLSLFETIYPKDANFTSLENLNVYLASAELNFGDPTQPSIIRLFGNRKSVLDMLKLETTELRAINYDKWWLFEFWKGNISTVVEEMRVQNSLNEIIIILYETLVNATRKNDLIRAYIDQLSSPKQQPNHENMHKAVLFALALYDTEKAIDIYLNHDLYQYALALAQIRLPPEHSAINEILKKYASYTASVGDYEIAVTCFIRLKDLENAYSTLLRRNAKGDEQCGQIIENLSKKLNHFLKLKDFV